MPLLAAIISGVFAQVFAWIVSRVSFNIAFALAVAATMAASIAAMKLALAGLWALVGVTAPPLVTQAFLLVLPANTQNVLTAVILTDVVRSSWDYWKATAGLVVGLRSL